jgi:hypothetical protein
MASHRTSPFGVSIQRGKKRLSVFWFRSPEGSNSLSHWIGPADGTRPQPMPTEINCNLSGYVSSYCGLQLKVRKHASVVNFNNVQTVNRSLIAVNRESYVVRADNFCRSGEPRPVQVDFIRFVECTGSGRWRSHPVQVHFEAAGTFCEVFGCSCGRNQRRKINRSIT